MILLDTHVLSEILRPVPDARVSGWLAAHPMAQLFTTSVTEAEIRYGVARLPDGQRKNVPQSAVEGLFSEDLSGRILPFDTESAKILRRNPLPTRSNRTPRESVRCPDCGNRTIAGCKARNAQYR